MLKIKDNVDLKELEKFGFEENKNLASGFDRYYVWRKSTDDLYIDVFFVVNLANLDLRFETSAYGMQEYDVNDFADILFNLIQTGLVEKV